MILNSPYISGSLTVTGNTTLQGALTVTGSLSGTATTASYALTLDGTGSVGFATTGAFTATSGSASSRLTQIEQVYATTGSNSFRATQSITGSLTVTGQIIAQTLNVQQVTSSIVYSSGSNVFGCDINSRQTFTGSFYQTGSLAVFNSLMGIGSSPIIATAAALQIEQAQSNIVAIRRADCSNTGNSRILFQAYNASGIVQNTGIVEAGLDNSATCGYIGFYAGTGAMNMKITAAGIACFSNTLCAANFITTGVTNSTSAVCSNYIRAYCDTSDTRYLQLYMGNPATYNPAAAGTVCKIVSGIEFNWYSENWKIGTTRGGGADIADFVFGRNSATNMVLTSGGNLQLNFNPGSGNLIFQDVTNGATMFYTIPATYVGSAPYNANRLLAANNSHITLETGGTERLRLNNAGGFGTQLCNFCLTGTYQTLVTVENGSYGLLMLSSCLGGGTYALYNIYNNAGVTSVNLIHGNNIPACVVGNAVRFASANSATYCDMRSSYIRFY